MDFVEQLSILLESSWAFGRPSAVHESGGLDYRLWAQLGCQSAWLRTNSQGFGKETKRWSGCDWWFYHTVPYFSIFFIVRLLEILYMTYTRSCVWCLYMVILCVFMQSCLWIYFLHICVPECAFTHLQLSPFMQKGPGSLIRKIAKKGGWSSRESTQILISRTSYVPHFLLESWSS